MQDLQRQQGSAEVGLRAAAIRLGDFISTVCRQLSGLALAIIVLVCTVNVIGRYLFAHAFSWAEETMVFCMIFIIFFASAAVTWNGQHLSLDMVLRKLPTRAQKAAGIATTIGAALLLVLLAYNSYDVVSRLYRFRQTTEALEIPMWIPQSFVPIGLILIAMMLLLRLYTHGPLPKTIDYSEEDHGI